MTLRPFLSFALSSSSRLLVSVGNSQRSYKDCYHSVFKRGLFGITIMGCNSSSASVTPSEMDGNWKQAKSVYDFDYVDIDGSPQSMRKFEGHTLIVVNVASK
ncbi:unnamed protein product [Orchesella dallaii]|uniref:Glutathione peroxidase n=1 Tax=Orchesella dallaii TaxID=48710 RepID=A0ABP1RW98_9HEXA